MSIAADDPRDQVAQALEQLGGWASITEVHTRVSCRARRTIRGELNGLVAAGQAEAQGELVTRRFRWKGATS